MTTEEFIRQKNKIIKKATNLIMVPEDQIVNQPKVKMEVPRKPVYLHENICTYCIYGQHKNIQNKCLECPMSLAGNECSRLDKNCTWYQVNKAWNEKATFADHQKIIDLVKAYNIR